MAHKPIKIPPMTPERLDRMVAAEDACGGCFSVGGLAVKMGWPVTPEQTEALLDDPNRGYYDREGKPISLRQWMELTKDKASMFLGEDQLGDKKVITRFLGDAFEDELRGEKRERPRVYGTAVFDVKPNEPGKIVAEFRSESAEQATQRHAALVEGLKTGTLEKVIESLDEDRVQ